MSFLLPLGLLGLLTLPIILLLHLFRNRREPLVVSSLRLWRGLHQRRQGMQPRTIPVSLLLLAQLLIAAVLALALAQPVFSFLENRPQHTIFILDNTVSMAATDTVSTGAANRFEAAREFVRTRLQEMGENDTFALITLNRHPELLFSGDSEQQPQAQQILDSLVPGGTDVDLPAALTLANGLIEAGEQYNQITVLTDNNYDIDAEDLPRVFAPLDWQTFGTSASGTPPNNQALVNVAARTQLDKSYRLFVRVVNYGDEAVDRTLQLSVDGEAADDSAVQLDPQGEAVRVWTIPAAAQTATVEIVEEDVLPLDNRADLLLANTASYQTLLLIDESQTAEETDETTEVETVADEEDTPPLIRALQVQPNLELTIDEAANLGNYDLDAYDLIVFDGLPLTLTEWPAGNLLLINPPLGHPLLTVENFVRTLRPDPDTASPLLDRIDLSGVYFNRLPQVMLPEWAEADLMAVPFATEEEAAAGLPSQSEESYPLIFHGTVAESRVVVWAFDMEASNLSGRLALPLLTDNTLASLLSNALPPVVPVGDPVALGQDLSIELPDGMRLSPSAQTGVGLSRRFDQTQQAGIYRVFNENGNLVGGFATQSGSSFESNLSTQFDPTVIDSVETGAGDASPEVEFTEYWPWLAGLALVVITLEGWLAWRK